MNKINGGGPISASIIPGNDGALCAVGGLLIRDWFAGMALQAYLSMPQTTMRIAEGAITVMETAGSCYEWADAMLEVRDRKEEA